MARPEMEKSMSWWHREPRLEDILSDSIVRVVMEADGVDPHELEAALRRTAVLLARRGTERSV